MPLNNMDRIKIENSNNKLSNGEYLIDNFDNLNFETEVNSVCDILIDNINNKSLLNIVVNEGSNVKISMLAEDEIALLDINISVKKNGNLQVYFADFAKKTINLHCVISLEEEGANAYFKLASLAAHNDLKNIDVSIKHLSPITYGKVDNYGVCKDFAKLTLLGTSHILKKSIKSKTQQNAKIMVFDEGCNAIAKPILKIDENDIEASHAAGVGKISDEHLFYLTSRGISENEAKNLITFGYLKPILLGFKEEEIKEHISSLIEGRI